MKHVQVIVPMFNEEEVLPHLFERLEKIFNEDRSVEYSVLCIDDGSTDQTRSMLERYCAKKPFASALLLSRNFGKEAALLAGIDHADADAVVFIDADLQDPPELIPDMVGIWLEEEADDVYAQRISRKGERMWKRFTSWLFYRILQSLTRVPIQVDTGDFRLLSRKAISVLREYRETQRYSKGLFSLIGLKKIPIQYERDPRVAGETKWKVGGLINLAIDGITSFTVAPLRIATVFGIIVSLCAFAYTSFIVIRTLVLGPDLPGYASLMSVVLFLGGIQLVALGLIGEYVGRIFLETKARPTYTVQTRL